MRKLIVIVIRNYHKNSQALFIIYTEKYEVSMKRFHFSFA
jgi:hypothetical protein